MLHCIGFQQVRLKLFPTPSKIWQRYDISIIFQVLTIEDTLIQKTAKYFIF